MARPTMTRARRRTVPLVVGTIGILGCAGVVLALTYRHNVRVDLTPERSYTLSTHAKKILDGLDRDVRITAFVRSGDPRTPSMKDLLWRVGARTPRVAYEFVDMNRSPARARQHGIERYGALVVESGGRRRDITNPSEGSLVSAILAVTRARERIVYFVTGHGEHAPGNSDRKSGCSIAMRTLEEELFRVRELPLVGPAGVPADATVVVVAGPRKDYLADEIARIEAYVARGGDLLLLLDPESPASVAALAASYGIVPLDEVVVDPDRRLAAGEGVTLLVSGLTPSFLVSGTLEAPPVFSYARPLRLEPREGAAPIAFLQTSAASYTSAPGADAGAPPIGGPGARTVGAAVVVAPPTPSAAGGANATAEGERAPGRVIVYGDADFATNGVIDYLGNKDLLVNSANWLARDDSLIAARAQQKEVGREQFFVTEAQGKMAFWLAAVAQPALFVAVGVGIFLRRRLT
jgi:ABC-type uncharacterized transport system involved in gliding motility auxiliary subunit